MPTLFLIRHAKAAWPAGVSDFERPLAERGMRDCVVGESLLNGTNFDLALVSSAYRTQSTANLLNLNANARLNLDDIYDASLGGLLHVLNQQQVNTLAIIGHSPGMPMLAWFLSGNRNSSQAQALRTKFPTLGIAKLEADLPFEDWHEGCATLLDFQVPRAEPGSEDID